MITGSAVVLFKDGKPVSANMRKTLTCNDDLAEAARLKITTNDPAYVEEIIMERNGEISVTKKNK